MFSWASVLPVLYCSVRRCTGQNAPKMLIGGLIKSIEEWGEKMGMTRREIDTACSKLRILGILMEKNQGCHTGFTTGLMSQT
ncbi:hypothetical protein VAE151_550196 [Vibrio aestuarianus]|uniref:Uncharacterized protein n=1 Tax=Vibrio aestuarianus TaxID=28171 RepID=A0ABN8TQQ7_9VIBR|nr:hypothetical protein VAE308_1050196 [Vibrio aestuarianus]CAH8193153.1 hypothetical protein VAE055_370196 [Vibrio aestuarianus]CAH8193273.1 hypothetical protein VAE032_270195 [Vibrio aestuarianus]CAH8193352.1 hypothetical protein VAE128_460197 [Vibrio aestuarianus]CAH8193578.1 hypothetical protein VAE130_570197 [Vibrio aestuarianus]